MPVRAPLTAGGTALAVLAVVLISVNLRPGTAVGPLLQEILAHVGEGPMWGGLLTALPGVCFAVFGGIAVGAATRIGIRHVLWLGMAAAAVGLLLRPFVTDGNLFLALTVLALGGAAVGNVLLPAFIKLRFPGRIAVMMTVYSTLLAVGVTGANAVAIPLAEILPAGWQDSLALWGLTAGLAALPMLALALRVGPGRLRPRGADPGPAMVRSPRALALGIFFGVQSLQAYTQFGWVPQIYRDGGLAADHAGLMISLIAVFGIPAGLIMPTLVATVRDLRWVVLTLGVLLVVGYLGLLLAPTAAPWAWAISLGISAAAFPFALALVTARSRDPQVTARLSGFVQTLGYALAAGGPLLVGVLRGATGGWTVPLWLLVATAVPFVISGWIACAPGHVDDELRRVTNPSPHGG